MKRQGSALKVGIPENQWLFLLETPLYSPLLMHAEMVGTVLLMRVDDLSSVRDQKLSVTIKFVAWRSESGTWVAALPFRLVDDKETLIEDFAYLNPRQVSEYELLLGLAQQELIHIFFLSPGLDDLAAWRIPWVFSQRQRVFEAIHAVDKELEGERLDGGSDPEFELAKREFQKSYSVKDLLSPSE